MALHKCTDPTKASMIHSDGLNFMAEGRCASRATDRPSAVRQITQSRATNHPSSAGRVAQGGVTTPRGWSRPTDRLVATSEPMERREGQTRGERVRRGMRWGWGWAFAPLLPHEKTVRKRTETGTDGPGSRTDGFFDEPSGDGGEKATVVRVVGARMETETGRRRRVRLLLQYRVRNRCGHFVVGRDKTTRVLEERGGERGDNAANRGRHNPRFAQNTLRPSSRRRSSGRRGLLGYGGRGMTVELDSSFANAHW